LIDRVLRGSRYGWTSSKAATTPAPVLRAA
jgi:hypothetical protein